MKSRSLGRRRKIARSNLSNVNDLDSFVSKETDLHTKRTGHSEFTDKTEEAAKPIDLESKSEPLPSSSEPVAGEDIVISEGMEMVVPEVNKELLAELEAMGFPTARATRALHFSGNDDIEAAVNWVAENENDPEIDHMPMVPAQGKADPAKPTLSPEEIKAKTQELQSERFNMVSNRRRLEVLGEFRQKIPRPAARPPSPWRTNQPKVRSAFIEKPKVRSAFIERLPQQSVPRKHFMINEPSGIMFLLLIFLLFKWTNSFVSLLRAK